MSINDVNLAVRGTRHYSFSEIDASRFFHYRMGEQVEIPVSFGNVGNEHLVEVELNWDNFSQPRLYDFFALVRIEFISDRSFNTKVIVRQDNDPFNDSFREFAVSKGKNVFTGRLPFLKGDDVSFPRKLDIFLEDFVGVSYSSSFVSLLRVSSVSEISASMFSTTAFYVTGFRLNPDDSIAFDSRLNVFSNSSSTVRDFDFLSKPLTCSSLFLFGQPDVSFFVVEEEDL